MNSPARNQTAVGVAAWCLTDDCMAIGDETIATRKREVRVGYAISKKNIPEDVRQLILQHPNNTYDALYESQLKGS